MKPNATLRLVSSSPIAESAEFGISVNDTAHIMQILRDQLYSDKVLAVLREYGSNAWDAHRDSGKSELPIHITLPKAADPTLRIRDFGTGLSPEAVFQIYTQYGASTKRNSDASVGMLGIGSKSGFAYSDSFTVTSYHGGQKRTYIAVLDASEKGLINLLHEEPCGDETGVEISMAVRPTDISEFESKAQQLFQYFTPRPTINTTLPKSPEALAALKHGIIYERQGYYDSRSWVAVMGCVSYRIDLDQLRGFRTPEEEEGIGDFLSGIHGALYFNIGEVQVSASREELKYSEETKTALVKKFNSLVDEYVAKILADIEAGGLTAWDKRLKAQVLTKLKLPVPVASKELTATHAGVKAKDGEKRSFIIVKAKTPVGSINIEPESRLILKDDRRALAGFKGLTSGDYYVHPLERAPWSKVEADLAALCQQVDIVGIPIVKLSTFTWETPRKIGGRTVNAKHKQRVFRYLPDEGYSRPYSGCWEGEDRTPTDDDVFVIINNFQTQGYDFGRYYREDAQLVAGLGGKLPEIYGYKTTAKKEILPKDCQGHHYPTWRETFVKSLVTPQVKDLFDKWAWTSIFEDERYYYRRPSVDGHVLNKVKKHLGDKHALTLFLEKVQSNTKYFREHEPVARAMGILQERVPSLEKSSAGKIELKALYDKYPLLNLTDKGMSVLWGDNAVEWAQYVTQMDKP